MNLWIHCINSQLILELEFSYLSISEICFRFVYIFLNIRMLTIKNILNQNKFISKDNYCCLNFGFVLKFTVYIF